MFWTAILVVARLSNRMWRLSLRCLVVVLLRDGGWEEERGDEKRRLEVVFDLLGCSVGAVFLLYLIHTVHP